MPEDHLVVLGIARDFRDESLTAKIRQLGNYGDLRSAWEVATDNGWELRVLLHVQRKVPTDGWQEWPKGWREI